jgi:uncharacterized membrane protein
MDEAREDLPRAETTLPSAGRAQQSLDRLLDLARVDYGLAALIGMAVVGLGAAIYLTTVHYAGVAPICSTTGVIDCARVTNSQWSVVPGTQLPITIPGMLWFLVSGGLAAVLLRARARGEPEDPRVRRAQLVWGVLGLVTVLYLVYIEIVKLHRLCEWCTVVHLLTFISFLVILSRMQLPLVAPVAPAPAPQRPNARQAAPRSSGASGASRMHGKANGHSAGSAPSRSGTHTTSTHATSTRRPAQQAQKPKRKR